MATVSGRKASPDTYKSFNDAGSPNDSQDNHRQRTASNTFFSSKKESVVDGKKIREIEIVGEKAVESEETMKKHRKAPSKKKSIDQLDSLNISCREHGHPDHEGWLHKKSGGHGIVPVGWKKLWCILKHGMMYTYKTSFDSCATYSFQVGQYEITTSNEKKRTLAFKLLPKEEDGELKLGVFAGETEEDVNGWVDILNKVSHGVDISQIRVDIVPDYADVRKRVSSVQARTTSPDSNGDVKSIARRSHSMSTHYYQEAETTGMPAGFGKNTKSQSAPRVRKSSANTAGSASPTSILAVGSMFNRMDVQSEDSASDPSGLGETETLNDILYKTEIVEVSAAEDATRKKATQKEIERLNVELKKLRKPGEVSPPPAKKMLGAAIAAAEEKPSPVMVEAAPRKVAERPQLNMVVESPMAEEEPAGNPASPTIIGGGGHDSGIGSEQPSPELASALRPVENGFVLVDKSECPDTASAEAVVVSANNNIGSMGEVEDISMEAMDRQIAEVESTYKLIEESVEDMGSELTEVKDAWKVGDAGTGTFNTTKEVFHEEDGSIVVVTTKVETEVIAVEVDGEEEDVVGAEEPVAAITAAAESLSAEVASTKVTATEVASIEVASTEVDSVQMYPDGVDAAPDAEVSEDNHLSVAVEFDEPAAIPAATGEAPEVEDRSSEVEAAMPVKDVCVETPVEGVSVETLVDSVSVETPVDGVSVETPVDSVLVNEEDAAALRCAECSPDVESHALSVAVTEEVDANEKVEDREEEIAAPVETASSPSLDLGDDLEIPSLESDLLSVDQTIAAILGDGGTLI